MNKHQNNINIKNKRAYFQYEILEKFIAGIELYGTEIKSVRQGKVSLTDGYCYFVKNELFVKMSIAEYSHGGHYNHQPNRERKLLLKKSELKRLQRKVKTTGLTIVPLRMFINERGWAKLEIALARGKKTADKREDIKQRDAKREMARARKENLKY